MARLLVVEDDERIGRLLVSALQANRYEVRWSRTGASALVDAAAGPTDLVLLDLGLPDLDGVAVCRELRLLQPGAVIVILTARGDEMDVVSGLESGADDYLTKPFRLVELMARVRAHLRRSAPAAGQQGPTVVEAGTLSVDLAARTCRIAGQQVALRSKEFDLLARLATEPGRAVSRETLMSEVWDENWFGSTKTLDVHIAAVRRKLSETAQLAAAQPPVITTLRGHGYRLEQT